MTRLVARRLSFGYRTVNVGRDVDVDIGSGRVICLLGPNGCGKTTLFRTLLALLPRQGGIVELDGRDIDGLSRRTIARSLAYVPQAHSAVFPFTVHDMVLMGRTVHRGALSGPTRSDRQRVDEALDSLGIGDLAEREYTRISGGQRQLALIARAVVQDAPLVVMDEPTASLDFGNQLLVLERVRQLASAGIGIVLSTHNPDHALAHGDQVLVLNRGTVEAAGPPAEVLSDARLSALYGVPVTVATLADGRRVCVPG